MTTRSLAHPAAPAAPAAAVFQTTLPPLDAAGILADLASLRTVIAEATRRYVAAMAGPEPPEVPLALRSPRETYDYMAPTLRDLDHEELYVILLSTKNVPLDTVPLYRGTLNSSTVRIGELFKAAIVANAASLIIVHNHPSGDPTPSPEDVRVTAEAVKAGQLLDIEVLDHVIVGRPNGGVGPFVSLRARGLGFGGGCDAFLPQR